MDLLVTGKLIGAHVVSSIFLGQTHNKNEELKSPPIH